MNSSLSQSSHTRPNTAFLVLSGLLVTLSLISLGFATEAQLSRVVILSLIALVVCAPLVAIHLGVTRRGLPRSVLSLSSSQIPLLICALIVNLKRGPWIGTLIAASVFCFLYARNLVIFIIASASVLACVITPVRERLLDSYEHFTISGGRSTIWRIGAELATEYPLGIGYHNSGIMREFAPEIPPELKHFHNNLINITTELGWLGGAIFVWLLCAVLRLCFRDRSAPLYTAIGCSLIAWQAAGLFEYNFGDSEITIIVWALVGLVLQREYRNSVLANSHHN
jgi:O-antigen ligase